MRVDRPGDFATPPGERTPSAREIELARAMARPRPSLSEVPPPPRRSERPPRHDDEPRESRRGVPASTPRLPLDADGSGGFASVSSSVNLPGTTPSLRPTTFSVAPGAAVASGPYPAAPTSARHMSLAAWALPTAAAILLVGLGVGIGASLRGTGPAVQAAPRTAPLPAPAAADTKAVGAVVAEAAGEAATEIDLPDGPPGDGDLEILADEGKARRARYHEKAAVIPVLPASPFEAAPSEPSKGKPGRDRAREAHDLAAAQLESL